MAAPDLRAIDLNAGGGALLIALLVNHDQPLLDVPGRTVQHASGGYRGSGRRDAKDAFVIAAQAQFTTVPRQATAAAMTVRPATEVMDLHAVITETGVLVEGRFRQHRHATTLLSMSGIGVLLGAEIVGLTDGEPATFGRADQLALAVGLASVPHASDQVQGNLHRPWRYTRRLLRAFYLSAPPALTSCPKSKAFYEGKKREAKVHKQVALPPAPRRLNVVWAPIRDDGVCQPNAPQPATMAA